MDAEIFWKKVKSKVENGLRSVPFGFRQNCCLPGVRSCVSSAPVPGSGCPQHAWWRECRPGGRIRAAIALKDRPPAPFPGFASFRPGTGSLPGGSAGPGPSARERTYSRPAVHRFPDPETPSPG